MSDVNPRSESTETADHLLSDLFPCFMCGICCTGYHILVTPEDCQRIAPVLGMTTDEFIEKYAYKPFPEFDNMILRHNQSRCPFLKPADGFTGEICSIHDVNPGVCRGWQAGPDRRQCLEGLEKCWQLKVGQNGRFEGTAQHIESFTRFIEGLSG
jgi:hypothetical protein